MKKKLLISLSVLCFMLFGVTPAFAHVTVKPAEVGVGTRLNFVVSVPTEEDVPTVQVRLVLPEGLQSVRPNVKPGWTISLTKSGDGEEAKITEIVWSGGSIPAEQRDEFVFSAQAPAEESTLVWKAYQTYGDGTIVSWDNSPDVVEEYTKTNPPADGEHDHNAPKPYSQTQVINDLKSENQSPSTAVAPTGGSLPMTISLVALLLGGLSVGMQLRKS